MRIDFIIRIKKALPDNFRIKIYSIAPEGFEDQISIIDPPEYCFIQAKFYGEKPITNQKREEGWLSIGELDFEEDIVFLWNEQYEKYMPIFREVLKKVNIKIHIEKGSSQNYTKYYKRGGFTLIDC
ncbi:MAG: hypothetical protein A2V72_02720 [Candidatus Nealsonbacteria bacterium RBG_13_37_56]|uniref:Uncharacterized protein n=1 Tax=Candidatus Nealsonbacteria bacterium RBG_13_37_56 TaxID=1801661 RepID=A0A1G2DYV9_9BACT|nr:MAG: hypothetical protein A2V72_02720 [Candidatus Nealsonbacteria bacterium RBG_13_37_56]HJX46013.1 hypothetical protein [Patescibacteria group bacterium]